MPIVNKMLEQFVLRRNSKGHILMSRLQQLGLYTYLILQREHLYLGLAVVLYLMETSEKRKK
jgi:hypothetical protein